MSHLYQQIKEQPSVLVRLVEEEGNRIAQMAEVIRYNCISYALIAARGCSDNAGTYWKYLLGMHNRLRVGLATPSTFTLYNMPPRIPDAIVIGISHCGQPMDVVDVMVEAASLSRRNLIPQC